MRRVIFFLAVALFSLSQVAFGQELNQLLGVDLPTPDRIEVFTKEIGKRVEFSSLDSAKQEEIRKLVSCPEQAYKAKLSIFLFQGDIVTVVKWTKEKAKKELHRNYIQFVQLVSPDTTLTFYEVSRRFGKKLASVFATPNSNLFIIEAGKSYTLKSKRLLGGPVSFALQFMDSDSTIPLAATYDAATGISSVVMDSSFTSSIIDRTYQEYRLAVRGQDERTIGTIAVVGVAPCVPDTVTVTKTVRDTITVADSTLKAQVDSLVAERDSLKNRVTTLQDSISALSDSLVFYRTLSDSAGADSIFTQLQSKMDSLQAEKAALEQRLVKSSETEKALKAAIKRLNTENQQLLTKVDVLKTHRLWLLLAAAVLVVALILCFMFRRRGGAEQQEEEQQQHENEA